MYYIRLQNCYHHFNFKILYLSMVSNVSIFPSISLRSIIICIFFCYAIRTVAVPWWVPGVYWWVLKIVHISQGFLGVNSLLGPLCGVHDHSWTHSLGIRVVLERVAIHLIRAWTSGWLIPLLSSEIYTTPFEPPHDKTNNMACAPSEDSDQSGHSPSLIRVFAVCMKKAWVLSYQLSTQRRLW